MLSLVAGPIDVVAAAGEALWLRDVLWCEALGCLVGVSEPSASGRASDRGRALYTVQLNGSARFLSGRVLWDGLGYYDDGDYLVTTGARFQRTQLPSTNVAGDSYLAPGYATVRQHSVSGGYVWSVGYVGGTAGVFRRALADETGYPMSPQLAFPTFESGAGALLPYKTVGGQRLWWAVSGTGRLWQYDMNANALVAFSRTNVGSLLACAYSRTHDLFITVRANPGHPDQLRVFANEPVAASISAPAFAEAPKRGARRPVSSQVLGDEGERCAGRVVQFTAAAGEIETAAVETDEAGTATTVYHAGSAGEETITATMVE